jgi:MoaA/NifB/PqqE/SkfB family radical SAM enzyme
MKPDNRKEFAMFRLIFLELTNFCNFKCEFCPTDRQTRARGYIDKGLAKRIIQEIYDDKLSNWITFNLMGEPYLHKDLAELCQFAEDTGVHVRLLTNGSLLNPDINRRIFATNLSRLEISFRTPNSTSFNERQRGNRLAFEDYLGNVKRLLEDRLTLKPRTIVEVKFFMDSQASFLSFAKDYQKLANRQDNTALMKSLHQHCLTVGERLGIDMQPYKGLNLQPDQKRIEIAPRIYLVSTRIQDFWVRENMDQSDRWVPARRGGCNTFREEFGILFNGDVTTCCVDFDGRNVVGNVRDRHLTEVLASPQVKRVRASFDRYTPPLDFCRKCLGGPNFPYSVTKQIMASARDFVARRRNHSIDW